MNSENAIKAFQTAIITAASEKLGRPLTDREKRFITARGGFIALEFIADTVRSETRDTVEKYLNPASGFCP